MGDASSRWWPTATTTVVMTSAVAGERNVSRFSRPLDHKPPALGPGRAQCPSSGAAGARAPAEPCSALLPDSLARTRPDAAPRPSSTELGRPAPCHPAPPLSPSPPAGFAGYAIARRLAKSRPPPSGGSPHRGGPEAPAVPERRKLDFGDERAWAQCCSRGDCAAGASTPPAASRGPVLAPVDSDPPRHPGGARGPEASAAEPEESAEWGRVTALGEPRRKRADPYDPAPRPDYLVWDDYFMAVAVLSSLRSKDPNRQVGAVIVSGTNVILGIGYNGFPRGCPDSQLPWAKSSRDQNSLSTKYPYVCHAEMNAIMNKNAASLEGSRIFVTLFPCNECAKLILQAGIREVVFYEDKNVAHDAKTPTKGGLRADPSYAASRRMLEMAGVALRNHRPREGIVISLMP